MQQGTEERRKNKMEQMALNGEEKDETKKEIEDKCVIKLQYHWFFDFYYVEHVNPFYLQKPKDKSKLNKLEKAKEEEVVGESKLGINLLEYFIFISNDPVHIKKNDYQGTYIIKLGLTYSLKAEIIKQLATSVEDLII
ncbi:hypothetical protein RFI_19804 [Reticulomyxa filosa]|uniref:Uncharacterized protein n=1 Tax=Reticulomyxa filosa TaxID=46433 RepID=X6MVN5_RETFI|nr:hypothetical protein RFI_19804 [Reticulomyxa filosa]|eukprot:ETO17517.1 hypothetical protein RFI_19804 [Reticulomyxa filosa]